MFSSIAARDFFALFKKSLVQKLKLFCAGQVILSNLATEAMLVFNF